MSTAFEVLRTPTPVCVPAASTPIERVAEQRLHESSYPSLRRVACEFHEGVLTLRGRVPSFHLKQLAQVLVGGLGIVENRIEVAAVDRAPAFR